MSFQESYNNYVKAVDTICCLTENIMGRDMNAEIKERWQILMGTMRVVDDRLDAIEDPAVRKIFSNSIVSYLENDEPKSLPEEDQQLNESMANLHNSLSNIDLTKKEDFLRQLKMLFTTTEICKRVGNDPDIYSFYKRLEGQMTARLFLILLPDEYQHSENYHHLVKSFTRLGRIGTSVDSFSDMPDDYRQGLTKLDPNLINRVLLLLGSGPDIIEFFQEIGGCSLDLLPSLIKRTKETWINSSNK